MKTQGAGRRRHRIIVSRRTLTGSGIQKTPTYTNDAARWASIEPLSAREPFSAREILIKENAAIYSEATHKITITYTRSPAPPAAEDRILFGSRVFEIVGAAINPEEANRELMYMVVERT
jgi:head-tail adaptor